VIAEATGAPGFGLNIGFENLVATGQELRILGYYDGGSGHTVLVNAFNGVDFDTLGTLPDATAPTLYIFTLDPGHTISGEVLINIAHTSAGTVTHRLHIDHMYVLDSATTPADNIDLSGATLSGGVDGPASAIDYQTGLRTFGVAADTWDDENTTAMRAIMDLVESERGFFWADRDGDLVFKNTSYEFGLFDAAAALTLSSTHLDMDAGMRLGDIYNRVTVRYTPRSVLDSGVVAAATSDVVVPPGKGSYKVARTNPSDDLLGEATTVRLRYVDRDSGTPMGAEDLELPLVPGTDYTARNRVGEDISSFGFIRAAAAETGSGVDVTLTSLRKIPITLENLQVRGVGIVAFDPRAVTLDDADSQTAYGRQVATITLPLEASDAQNFAESLAAYSLGQWKDPAWRVETLAFGTDLVIGSTNVLSLELGNVVDVTEAQTATSGQRALVVGALYSLRDGEARATLRVRRIDTQTYWRLDDATYSVLGSTTRLTI
jgi:hypothetical protein